MQVDASTGDFPDITVQFAARAIEAVRAVAMEEIVPRYRSVTAERKADGSLVTEADYAAQDALVRRLAALAPVPVIGEEMPEAEHLAIHARGTRFWCLDPLDGTSNFAAGIPFFAISLALFEADRPVFGTVYDPIADEAYYAVRHAGAWLNHKPLRLGGDGPALAGALAEVSLRRETAWLRGILKRHPPYRRRITSGSSALSWCHLAAGRIDVLLHSGQKVWDYGAGALILAEAGGHFGTLEDEDFWTGPIWKRSVVGGRTAALHAAWRAWLQARIAERAAGTA